MANFYVTHHKYPDSPQLFTVNVATVIKRSGEPNTQFYYGSRGEQFWEVYIATSALDINGESIPPFWADVVTSEASIDDLIRNKIEELCGLIDWTNAGEYTVVDDRFAPTLLSQYPLSNETNVPITSTIKIVVGEGLPGVGLDISTMYLKVNGVNVTPRVSGHPYNYTISFSPRPIF